MGEGGRDVIATEAQDSSRSEETTHLSDNFNNEAWCEQWRRAEFTGVSL